MKCIASDLYMEAYFQGRWVYVPIRNVPQEASFDLVRGSDLYAPIMQRCCDDARDKIAASITEIIDPEDLSERKLRELCRHNDIPLAWVSNRFSKTMRSVPGTGVTINRRTRKYVPLTAVDFRQFIRALLQIHPQAALIAQIIWYLNKAIDSSIPLEALLRVKANAIAPEEDPSRWIKLSYFCNGVSHFTVCYLPEYLWRRLCRQITEQSYIIFSNKHGAPLLVGDLDRAFASAGEIAGIKGRVTSLSLRYDKRVKRESVLRKTGADSDADVSEISVSEWESIVSGIPWLFHKRGRKPKYDSRDVLNCIFLHLREGLSIRQASIRMSIPEDVVESQFRRWRESGVMIRIFKARAMA